MREQIMECETIQRKLEKLQNDVVKMDKLQEEGKIDFWTYKDYKSDLKYWNKIYENKCKGMFDLFCQRSKLF